MSGNSETGTIFLFLLQYFYYFFFLPAFICDDSFQSLFYNVESI